MERNNALIKLEAHLHTAEVSTCAKDKAADIVAACHEKEYGAIVVTDHYIPGKDHGLPGEFKTLEERRRFLTGYHNAKKAAKAYGMVVLPGMEFRLERGMEDFLVYGMEEQDFDELPGDMYRYSLKEFHAYCSEHGWLVYQAHPFREGLTVQDPTCLDGIEVYNGNPNNLRKDTNHNDLAVSFARKHDLLAVVGTDVHRTGDVGGSCLYVPEDLLTPRGLVKYLKTRRARDCTISI